MQNLFKKIKQSVQLAMQSPVNVNEVVEKIHNDFDTAGEKLLKEAKEILSKNHNTKKGERLKSLGFLNSEPVVKSTADIQEREEKRRTAELIEHYQIYYPNNKFITEKLVEQICKKYGLVWAEVRYYKGDVPEKNISEMEAFKLRDEDKQKYYPSRERYNRQMEMNVFGGLAQAANMSMWTQNPLNSPFGNSRPRPRYEQVAPPIQDEKPTLYADPFKICAPEKDFDMTYLKKIGSKLQLHIPDPIVLQPVSGGYLIVSKWGLEGKDESLVNEKQN